MGVGERCAERTPAAMSDAKTYRRYMLGLLTLLLASNVLDRIAVGIMLQDIKTDLALSDTQLGLLTGIAFAIFYALMGIPIARWADRGNRVTIISLTAVLWSVMVALCAIAGSFVQLLLIRVGVGIGEAGAIPPAQSLIADHFPRADRPRAAAIYALGGPISFFVGYFAAGWLNELYGWRTTFVIVGVPGAVLGALAWFTLREPRVQASAAVQLGGPASPDEKLTDVFRILWRNITFRHLLIAFSLTYLFGYGLQQWLPVFFIRSHGLETGELGTWLSIVYGPGSLIGILIGGEWAARFAIGNESLQLRMTAFASAAAGAFQLAVLVPASSGAAFVLLAVVAALGSSIYGPLYATIQSVAPPRMRAMAIAVVLLFANMIGMGLGPLVAGMLSDLLARWWPEDSLRYALMIMCPGYAWCMFHLFLASRTVHRSIDEAEKLEAATFVDSPAGTVGAVRP